LFKTHVAKLKDDNTLIWSAPDSTVNRIDYLLYKNYLIIVGDYGESIFCRESGFEFWAFSDLSYIMGKIQACSENLNQYDKGQVWDTKQAIDKLNNFLKFFASEYWVESMKDKEFEKLNQEILETYDSKRKEYLYTKFMEQEEISYIHRQLMDSVSNYDEYRGKLHEIQNELYKAFGDSFYEFPGLMRPGSRRSFRIEAQFLGLRLALAQLGITDDKLNRQPTYTNS
jgi:hypothetical protein